MAKSNIKSICYSMGLSDAMNGIECCDEQFDGLVHEEAMKAAYLEGYYAVQDSVCY